jgi:hypothetical protein
MMKSKGFNVLVIHELIQVILIIVPHHVHHLGRHPGRTRLPT